MQKTTTNNNNVFLKEGEALKKATARIKALMAGYKPAFTLAVV